MVDARKFILGVARRLDTLCGSQMERETERLVFPDRDVDYNDIYFALFRTLGEFVPLPELHALLPPTERYNAWYCGQLLHMNARKSYRGVKGQLDRQERKRRFRLHVQRFLTCFIVCLLNTVPQLYRVAHERNLFECFSLNNLELALRLEVESLRLQLRSAQGRDESAMSAAAC